MTETGGRPLVACHECDRLHHRAPVPEGARADCARCGASLYEHIPNSLDRALALYLAAFVLLILANIYPFLSMKIGGLIQQNHLFSGAWALYELGMGELGLVVLLTSIVLPMVSVSAMLWLLIPVRLGFVPWKLGLAWRIVRATDPWSLIGVFMLGTLISVVKLKSMAAVIPGVGLYAFALLIVVHAAARANFDPEVLFSRLPQRGLQVDDLRPGDRVLHCHACGHLELESSAGHDCARCGASLHHRVRDSLTRTWALVISATLLMIPAQLYPVMTVMQLGRGSPDTIISGVIKLVSNGFAGLAIIVFIASIAVPFAKLLALVFLLRSVEKRSKWKPRDRTLLYRVTEVIGAWSMVDVFLVGLLSGLVSLNVLATITPGIGASFFGAVVILTMFAAHSFDPRLIWDEAEENPGVGSAAATTDGNELAGSPA